MTARVEVRGERARMTDVGYHAGLKYRISLFRVDLKDGGFRFLSPADLGKEYSKYRGCKNKTVWVRRTQADSTTKKKP